MYMAKIYQKRHERHHFVNKTLVDVEEEIHYKIIFSHPEEMEKYEKQVKKDGGLYQFNKDTSIQEGKLPRMKGMKKGTYCWCDYTTYYLLYHAGYDFQESTSPYKCEIFIKKNGGWGPVKTSRPIKKLNK